MKVKLILKEVGKNNLKNVIIEMENETIITMLEENAFSRIIDEERDQEIKDNKRYYLKGIEDIDEY